MSMFTCSLFLSDRDENDREGGKRFQRFADVVFFLLLQVLKVTLVAEVGAGRVEALELSDKVRTNRV